MVAAVAGLVSAATPARADPASDAKDLFERGHELRSSGRCDQAVALFRKAYALYPQGLGSLRNIAECEQALGHWASARRAWLDLSRAAMLSHEARYAGWEAEARGDADALAPRVARVTLDVVDTAGHPIHDAAVKVTLAGEEVAPVLYGTALERDPGSYVARAELPPDLRAEATVTLAAGDDKHVRLVLPAARAPLHVRQPDVTPAPHRGGGARRALGWTAVGLGAASLVGMGVSLGVRQDALGQLQDACPGYATASCPDSLRGVVDRGNVASALVTVLAITGGVATAAGVVLLLTAPASASPRAAVSVGLGGVSAAWSF